MPQGALDRVNKNGQIVASELTPQKIHPGYLQVADPAKAKAKRVSTGPSRQIALTRLDPQA